jgi:hypothetical protein
MNEIPFLAGPAVSSKLSRIGRFSAVRNAWIYGLWRGFRKNLCPAAYGSENQLKTILFNDLQ